MRTQSITVTHSLAHSPSLFDTPETEAFALEKAVTKISKTRMKGPNEKMTKFTCQYQHLTMQN